MHPLDMVSIWFRYEDDIDDPRPADAAVEARGGSPANHGIGARRARHPAPARREGAGGTAGAAAALPWRTAAGRRGEPGSALRGDRARLMFVVDSNVLIYAANADSAEHERCRELLEGWRASRELWY